MSKKLLYVFGIIIVLIIGFQILKFLDSQSKEDTILNIGVIASVTGSGAPYGRNSLQGIQLAVEEINNSGGINGNQVKILLQDDSTEARQAVSAFEKLISIYNVKLVIGPASSSGVMACAPIANEKQIVILSPGAASPNISEAGDFIFRNRASGTQEALETARFVLFKLNRKTSAILRIQTDYGVGFEKIFQNEFVRGGGRILGSEVFQQGATDMRAQILRLKRLNPQTIYLVGVPGEVSRALIQMKELSFTPIILTNNMESPELIKNAGDAAEGIYFAIPKYNTKSKDSRFLNFAKSYREHFNSDPDMFAADGYDAVFLVKRAIETHGKLGSQIRDGLYAIKNFPGVYGAISIDRNGDVIKPLVIRTVQKGKFINIE